MIVMLAKERIECFGAWRVRGWLTRQVSTYGTTDPCGCDGADVAGGGAGWTTRAQPRFTSIGTDVPVDATELMLERLTEVGLKGLAPTIGPSAGRLSKHSGSFRAGMPDDSGIEQTTGTDGAC